MTKQEKNGTKKSRGRPASGQGTQIQVRVPPDLLAVIDRLISELGGTRPDILRMAAIHWAESFGEIPPKDFAREVSVMVSIPKTQLAELEKATALDRDEAINFAVDEWLAGRGREKIPDDF